MISRNWHCLSCRKVFHSFERNSPECPVCGSLKCTWVPGGGHVAKLAPGVDQTVKQLAFDYGMSDVNSPSPSRLNRAMPRPPVSRTDNPTVNLGGVPVPVPMDEMPVCVPTSIASIDVLPGGPGLPRPPGIGRGSMGAAVAISRSGKAPARSG